MQEENESSICLEQKLAKEVRAIYAKLFNTNHHPVFIPLLFSVLEDEISRIIENYPGADAEKLISLLEGDDEYGLSPIFEVSNNSEEEQNETVALGEDSNEVINH